MKNPFLSHLIESNQVRRSAAHGSSDLAARRIAVDRQHCIVARSDDRRVGQQVLSRQAMTRELFGEIAVSMMFLTASQVERLLEIQRFRRYAAAVEGLALIEELAIEDGVDSLARFLHGQPISGCVADESLTA